jgi:hypothetical protein
MPHRDVPALLRNLADHHAAISVLVRDLAARLDEPDAQPTGAPASFGDAPTPHNLRGVATPSAHSAHFPVDSLRWHAERALAEEGGPLSLDIWAERVRAQGFAHDWDPQNPRQLEASLSALPHQTSVFVRVGRRIYDLAARTDLSVGASAPAP